MNTLAILSSDSRNLTTFVERNSARYNIKQVSLDELTRNQVMVFSKSVATSVLTARLLWEQRTYALPQANVVGKRYSTRFHKADKSSYIVDYTASGSLECVRLTWEYIATLQVSGAQASYDKMIEDVCTSNDDGLHIWVHQLYEYRPQLKAIRKATDLQQACDTITHFYGYDVDAYSFVVDDKLSVFTCHDDHNEYLQKGESTSHSEDRGRIAFNYNSLLASIMNAVQTLAYVALGITEEHDVRAKQNSDTIAYWQDVDDACGTDYADHCGEHEQLDINPDWL